MSNVSGVSGLGAYLVNAANAPVSSASSQQAGNPFAALNLSPAQQTAVQKILQNVRTQQLSPSQVASQIDAVLTPAQQAKLQQILQSRQGQHHHHHHSGNGWPMQPDDGTDAFGIPTSISAGSSTATQAIGNLATSFSLQSQWQNNEGHT